MCPTGTSINSSSGYRSAFDVLDADHDGKISSDDLRKFTKNEFVGEMISVADENKDGFVEYEEFEKVVVIGRERNGRSAVMEEVFGLIDRDGDGKVGNEDLKSYLKLTGFDLGEDEIKAMIKLGGGNDINGVTFDGFMKILAL
ncbi:calcium-binding protein CP1 [Impatiens glandulifera]|uniref:calcium-binding protein CP1 n=1 Tax=Impatiens glandulifera TaxID=253017 RepID=UPI001FB130CB|nr:calcium-binding protein CP1 [Impatiens glandulifera]